jgi:Ca2+-binding EF-hand superfamily protein
MGQLIGKARLTKESQPFSNLSTEAIQESWDKFNEVAEGFGVSMDVFKSICGVLVEEVALGDEDVLSDYAESIFRTFDTDENDLVDALEFLASFAMISGMDLVGKVKFMFDCYDFDESGQLTIDEMTLSLKSTITGLAKLTNQEPPTEQDLETISQDAFRSSDLDSDQKISFEEFLTYCRVNPEVRSFVDYYDSIPEQWGTWDELNNTEVAQEMTRDRLNRRQIATVKDFDYCGLIPGEVDMFDYTTNEKKTAKEREASLKQQSIVVSRPWMDECLEPATAPDDLDFSSPTQACSVEWVYGYTGQRVRNNARYSLEGDILYPVGNMVIIYNKVRHAQKYYTGHRGEVMSIAVHPEGRIVASGDANEPCPSIDIWDSSDRERKHVLRGIHRAGVTLLSFSPDGSKLASVGMDDRHLLVIYDYRLETALYSCAIGPNKVLDCQFVDQTHIVTCGLNNVDFWSAVQGSKTGNELENSYVAAYERKEGLFGPKFKKQAMTCVCPIPAIAGKVATGTISGELYVWDGRKVCASLDAHDGPCTVLHAASTGVLSGGSEGKIILWSPELEQLATFDMVSTFSYNIFLFF